MILHRATFTQNPMSFLQRRCAARTSLVAVGAFALAIGVVVYLTDRRGPLATLASALGASTGHHLFGDLGQWLPSFVHPFAFSLFTAAVLPRRSAWQYAGCVGWGAVNIAFEVGQHPRFSAAWAGALQTAFGSSPWVQRVANYFTLGTFDGSDIVAAILGSLAAAAVLWLGRPRWEKVDAT